MEVALSPEKELEKGLELMEETHKEVKEAGVCQLEKDGNKLLDMNKSIPLGDSIIAIYARKKYVLDERNLSYVFVPEMR